MRLLRIEHGGVVSLVEFFGNIPPYAILSHTWGSDDQEISFKEIVKGKGHGKAGYRKIQFCVKQAVKDGLHYFWMDTCCIDKSSSAELSEAINSMFRWYRNAAKCYVYLADVSINVLIQTSDAGSVRNDPASQQIWKPAFQQSRWFTRGWTLQELLAPASVEFFSTEDERLGDKVSLIQQIHEATGISVAALKGIPLSQFDVDEKLTWAAKRETKREEDAAYSLLGLFDLHMPLIYGEGRRKAFTRLHREIQSASAFESPHITDMQPPQSKPEYQSGEVPRSSLLDHTGLPRTLEPIVTEAPAITPQTDVVHVSQKIDMIEKSFVVARNANVEMQTWWDETIAKTMIPDSYDKVAVLLIKWADEIDELKTRDELEELECVFRERFHFHTEVVELNVSSKPQYQMDRRLIGFIEDHDGPDSLLIVYYTGHGVYHENYEYLEFAGSFRPPGKKTFRNEARTNWSRTEEILRSDDVEADVLTILDTTYSSNLMKSGKESPWSHIGSRIREGAKTFELLSACGIDQTTAAPGENSFTRAMIDALIELLNEFRDRSFSTFILNQRILLDKRRYDTPSQLWFLSKNSERHIRLAPLRADPTGHGRDELSLQRARGYLTLGISLRDEFLNREQIESMARTLTKLNNALLGVRRIDWLGIKRSQSNHFGSAGLAMLAIARWKKLVRKRRLEKYDRDIPVISEEK